MIPDLMSTLVAIALVCAAVLDAPLLESRRAILAIGGAVLAILGRIANRDDYLRKCCNFKGGDGGGPERNWAARSQAAKSNSWLMNCSVGGHHR